MCDGDTDCADHSDEEAARCGARTCAQAEFRSVSVGLMIDIMIMYENSHPCHVCYIYIIVGPKS